MAYFKQCGRHHYHSDYNLKLEEELSYFDRDGLQDFLTTPCINYACNFLTDSFFSLLLFEYSNNNNNNNLLLIERYLQLQINSALHLMSLNIKV